MKREIRQLLRERGIQIPGDKDKPEPPKVARVKLPLTFRPVRRSVISCVHCGGPHDPIPPKGVNVAVTEFEYVWRSRCAKCGVCSMVRQGKVGPIRKADKTPGVWYYEADGKGLPQ